MRDLPPIDQINMSGIKVAGVGGLGMVAVVMVMAVALAKVGWFVTVSLAGGGIGGLTTIAYRHHRGPLYEDPPGAFF